MSHHGTSTGLVATPGRSPPARLFSRPGAGLDRESRRAPVLWPTVTFNVSQRDLLELDVTHRPHGARAQDLRRREERRRYANRWLTHSM